MKISIKLTCFVLSILFTSCHQEENLNYPEYYRNFNEVLEYLKSGKINYAIVKFDSICTKVPHIPSSHLFTMAKRCAEQDLCELSSRYLEKSLESGKEYGKGIGVYKTIDNCKSEINKVLEKESKIHAKQFNYKYKREIDSMFQIEQKAREEIDFDSVRIIDSMNMIKILDQIEEFGYPSEKIIGHESAFNAFIILLHMDRDKNNKVFKPILEKAYNEGHLSPRSYAWIVDRRRVLGNDKLEPYYYHLSSKKFESFNHIQLNEVNRRRDSIGLEPN